jgi:hypothetical protein
MTLGIIVVTFSERMGVAVWNACCILRRKTMLKVCVHAMYIILQIYLLSVEMVEQSLGLQHKEHDGRV